MGLGAASLHPPFEGDTNRSCPNLPRPLRTVSLIHTSYDSGADGLPDTGYLHGQRSAGADLQT